MPVANQRYLQISFVLVNHDGPIDVLTLPIRPEELTRTEPSRVAVVNSLDGAWVDAFGRGLATLTITGNTGWGQMKRPEGGAQFEVLRDYFIHEWHVQRRAAIDKGLDPNEVRLIFVDALNNKYVADVVPTNFVLRRSKSQPLLFLYNITMVVVKEKAENPYPDLMEPTKPLIYLDSLLVTILSAIGKISGILARTAAMLLNLGPLGAEAATLIQGTVLPAMVKACDVIRLAAQLGQDVRLIPTGYIELAGSVTIEASGLLAGLSETAGLPTSSLIPILQLKTELGSAGSALLGSIA